MSLKPRETSYHQLKYDNNIVSQPLSSIQPGRPRYGLRSRESHPAIVTPITKLRGRFGAGVSREFGSADDDWKPEADLGIDFEHKISDRQRFEFTTDYYPTWKDFSDYRLVANASCIKRSI